MLPTGLGKSNEDCSVTDKRTVSKPPLPPKPQLNLLHPPPHSDRSTARRKPVPKPRLRRPTLHKQTSSGPDGSVNESGPTSPALSPTSATCSPQQEESPCVHTGTEDSQQHTEHDITRNQEGNRVPPNVPVPVSVPSEPCQSSTMKVKDAEDDDDDDDMEGPYMDVDMPADGNVTSSDSPTSPVPAVMPSQARSRHQYAGCDLLDVCNEPRKILSGETPDKPEITKLSFVKDMVKIFCSNTNAKPLSEEERYPKTKLWCFQNNTKAEKTLTLVQSLSSLGIHKARNTSLRRSKRKTSPSQRKLQEGLWQQRSVVRESNILSKLSKEELHLQERIYEVLTSEQSYLEKLTVAVDHFQESQDLSSAIVPKDKKALFSNIDKMKEFSQNFLDSMVKKLDSSMFCDPICDVVHHYTAGPLGDYVKYIRNMPYQKETLQNLRRDNPEAAEILTHLEEDPRCGRLPLESFLSLPYQRIFHLKLLMETVLKVAASDSNVRASAEKALTEICKVLDVCSKEVDMMKQMEELVNIANKTDFECKVLPLVSSSRSLVRQGDVMQLNDSASGQKKHCSLHLILFNDLLLVATKKKGSDRYVVHKYVHRSLIEVTGGADVQENLEGYDVSRIFLLEVLKDNNGASYQVLLQTSSREERDGWLEVLRSEEGVYEEWDCPQVVCIKPYQGLQPGELSLQLGDVINIIQRTPNGRMEGRKFSDGERGCFPDEFVREILNEHVQRRHLRQLNHALQTAVTALKPCSLILERHTTTCFK